MFRSRVVPALAAVAVVTALAGCGGGSTQPAAAPSTQDANPGEGRKPASGAWLHDRYGDWSAEHGTATEGHFRQGTAYGPSEQLKQPTIVVRVNKGHDRDVRTSPLLTDAGAAPDPKAFGEAWCSARPDSNVCLVQLDGGSIEFLGTNTNRAVMGALATEIYGALSADPNAPEPTQSSTPSNSGEGRKPIAGKVLPRAVGEWEVMVGATDTFAVYLRPGANRLSEGALVNLMSGDHDARKLASLTKAAEQNGEAWCQAVGSREQCYVQLDGGVLHLSEGDNQPAGDVVALANALYEAL